MNLWPHQVKAIDAVYQAVEAGERRIVLCIPTGGGKTVVMARLAKDYLDQDKKVILYTDRRMLLEQTSGVFEEMGLPHGVRAAGHSSDLYMPFQIASIQTEHSRTMKRKRWKQHDADLVLIDEPHKQTGETVEAILTKHYSDGAVIVGPTATPIGLGHMYDKLIVAANVSDCVQCGALVRAHIFAPNEPDYRKLKKPMDAVLTENDVKKTMGVHRIIASVLEWFNRLNPERRPSILFAPGVEESIWFAQQFNEAGIKAAHIDGDDVWIDGEFIKANSNVRKQLLEASKNGDIKVLCNRFVLREGIDAPWLSHGIFATIFGTLQTYLQSGGRLLRAFPGLDHVTVQDHGGNYLRYGSLNADWDWTLEATNERLQSQRADRLRTLRCGRCDADLVPNNPWCPVCQFYNEREPVVCPKCKRVLTGWRCPCGWQSEPKKRPRTVVQLDGTLVDVEGDLYKPRRFSTSPRGPAIWKRVFFRARNPSWNGTFRQAFAVFAQENKWFWPDPRWPLMPLDPADSFKLVAEVPWDRLRPDPDMEAYQS